MICPICHHKRIDHYYYDSTAMYVRDITALSFVVEKRGEVPPPLSPEDMTKKTEENNKFTKKIYDRYGYCSCALNK